MIRALRVARRSAVKARTQAANQLHALVVTAPDELRSTVRRLGIAALVATVSQWRPGTCPDTPLEATRFAMKSIALRCSAITPPPSAADAPGAGAPLTHQATRSRSAASLPFDCAGQTM